MSPLFEYLDDADPLIDRRVTLAFSHPIRLRLLELLSERISLTPLQGLRIIQNEGAEITLIEVGDHLEVLRRLKFVELVLRGGKDFGYRLALASFIDDTVWHKLPDRLRPAIWVSALQAFNQQSIAALKAGKIERRESQFNLAQIVLDEQGWRKVVGAIAESLFLVEEAHQESVQRADSAETSEGLSPALIALTAFEVVRTQGSSHG